MAKDGGGVCGIRTPGVDQTRFVCGQAIYPQEYSIQLKNVLTIIHDMICVYCYCCEDHYCSAIALTGALFKNCVDLLRRVASVYMHS
jgi:hypothetical protein